MTKKAADFGKLFAELEDITAWFERADVDVEEGLKKFERGLVLAKQCKEFLDEVDVKVKTIKKKYDADTSVGD
ncbi:exodeoxyribonuclease VII small subunit [Candidatus Uhrbacteria bacterium]|nr:exodeoxyribonuclease VII small subunit [Candidatus Uhrbacteria bacterium]